MSFLLAAAAFAATVFALLFVAQIYHRPDHPEWLDGDFVANAVCVGFTSALAGTFGALIDTALALPLPVWGDAAAVFVTALVVFFGVRYLFRSFVAQSARARIG